MEAYRFLDFSTVHHEHHVIDSDAGLCDVGGNHDLPHPIRRAVKHLRDTYIEHEDSGTISRDRLFQKSRTKMPVPFAG